MPRHADQDGQFAAWRFAAADENWLGGTFSF